MKLTKIIDSLEKWAPPIYQESYDNSGLLIGNKKNEIKGCLISLDCTEKVIDEALKKGCNLIISHHPLIFEPIKSIISDSWISRTIEKAIKNNINIYAFHTNLDNVITGVNKKISDLIGLKNISILSKKRGYTNKLEIYIPQKSKHTLMDKLYEINSGTIGNYKECSFSILGKGSFIPTSKSNPTIGKKNSKQVVEEEKIEILFHKENHDELVSIINKYHPYQEPTFFITKLENTNHEIGSGIIGKRKILFDNLLKELKKTFNKKMIKHTKPIKKNIKTIAVCGGSGSFLIDDAINKSADVFITSDLKYHEYFKSDNKLVLIDIGHYESEQYTKDLIFEFLNKKLINIALHLSKVDTNPVKYY